MSSPPLIQCIVGRLQGAGYELVSTPFQVASVSFDFTAALRGSEGRGLDLVIIIDTVTGDYGDRDASRVRQRIEALSRALDLTGSRYLLTTVLAGASLPGDIDALSTTCRVLNIEDIPLDGNGQPVDAVAAEALDDHIRVLLPLDLGQEDKERPVAGGDAVKELLAALPEDLDERLVRSLADASVSGSDAVTQALGRRLAEALALESPS